MRDLATVYGLCSPVDGALRYVGCTREPPAQRLRRHLNRAPSGTAPKDAWLRTLLSEGLQPTVRTLQVVPAEEMFTAESRWVGALWRGDRRGY